MVVIRRIFFYLNLLIIKTFFVDIDITYDTFYTNHKARLRNKPEI